MVLGDVVAYHLGILSGSAGHRGHIKGEEQLEIRSQVTTSAEGLSYLISFPRVSTDVQGKGVDTISRGELNV